MAGVRAAKGLAVAALACSLGGPAHGAPAPQEREKGPPCAGQRSNVVGTDGRDTIRLTARCRSASAFFAG